MNVLPNGLVQGSPEDKALWWTCTVCSFRGPFVGVSAEGSRACLASCGGVTPNPDTCFTKKDEPIKPTTTQPDDPLDVMMRHFQAELACDKYRDYTIEVAVDRSRKFARRDRAARDARNNLIIFGESYTYQREGRPPELVDVVGLDLRSPGWVMVWDVGGRSYTAVESKYLEPCS